MNKTNKKIRQCDILVWFSLVFMLITRTLTLFYMSYISTISGASIEKVALVYELNPISRILINLQELKYILIFFIIPAIIIAFYWLIRRKVIERKVDLQTFIYYTHIVFLCLLFNVLNDVTVFIAKVML